MTRVFFILSLIFFEGIVFAASWYESGMTSLRDRARHDGRSGRLRNDFCDELHHHAPHDDRWERDIRRIREEPEDEAFEDLSHLMDELERQSRGMGEEIMRRIMRRWNMRPEPMSYKLLTQRLTPSAANQSCKSQGGQLAMIRSGEEQTLAWEAADKSTTTKVFIGLRLRRRYGHHDIRWQDGSEMRYSNLKNRIDDYYDCGVLIVRTGKWNFYSCSKKLQALCEFPVKKTTASPRTSPNPQRIRTSTKSPRLTRTSKPSRMQTTKRPYRATPRWTVRINLPTEPPRKWFETEVRLDVDFYVAKALPTFNSTFVKSAAALLGKKENEVYITDIRPGSTIVKVKVLLAFGETADILRHILQTATKKGEFLDSKFKHLRSLPQKETEPEKTPEPEPESKPNHMRIFIPIIIVLVIAILVGAAILLLFMMKRKRRIEHVEQSKQPSRATAYEEQPPPYKEFEANEMDYTQPPRLDGSAPPKYDECMDTRKELHI